MIVYLPFLTRSPIYALSVIFAGAIMPTLGSFFLFFLYFLLTRRDWLAAVAYITTWLIPCFFIPTDSRDVLVILSLAYGAVLIFLYLRFGLLTVAATSVAADVLVSSPVTLDFSAWYSGGSIVYLGVLIGMAAYGFVVASGGQALAWVSYVTGEADARPQAAVN
jgi:hypothetical protein